MEWNERSLEAALAMSAPVPEVEMNARLNQAENLLVAQGRLKEAAEHFEQVEAVVRDPGPQLDWMRWRYSERFFHSYGEYWAEHSGSGKNIAKARGCSVKPTSPRGALDEAEAELAAA
jgi:hypothetical protein